MFQILVYILTVHSLRIWEATFFLLFSYYYTSGGVALLVLPCLLFTSYYRWVWFLFQDFTSLALFVFFMDNIYPLQFYIIASSNPFILFNYFASLDVIAIFCSSASLLVRFSSWCMTPSCS